MTRLWGRPGLKGLRGRPALAGGEKVAEKALFFGGECAGFDFSAIILYPVQDATVLDLLLIGEVVVLIDESFELTEVSVPDFVASGEH